MGGDTADAAGWVPMPKIDAPLDAGVDGEALVETPANKLLARLVLLVSTLGNSDSRGFGGAIKSNAGVGGLAGAELVKEATEFPELKDEELWLELPNTEDETTGAGAICSAAV